MTRNQRSNPFLALFLPILTALRQLLLLPWLSLGLIGLTWGVHTASTPSAEEAPLHALVGERHFDFFTWQINAWLFKGEATLAAGHLHLTEAEQQALVLEFAQELGVLNSLEFELERVFTDPTLPDRAASSQRLQQQIAIHRSRLADIQPLAESIIEAQVTAVLLEEGFGSFGGVFPPVQMHLTPLPSLLVVSPRDRIERLHQLPLEHGLLSPERAALEAQILSDQDLAAYVTNIGGLAVYPAMIVETSNLAFIINTTAHEWVHHWLSPYPLGYQYNAVPGVNTINETVASLVGDAIGLKVLQRYYPQLLVNDGELQPTSHDETANPFDFNAEMRTTRLEVDRLLAAGQVEAAEAYMETRRQYFVEHGYNLRVLNQAFFAFHGAYADAPGASGGDPIGPLVRHYFERSSSIKLFMEEMRWVDSLEELQELVASPREM